MLSDANWASRSDLGEREFEKAAESQIGSARQPTLDDRVGCSGYTDCRLTFCGRCEHYQVVVLRFSIFHELGRIVLWTREGELEAPL